MAQAEAQGTPAPTKTEDAQKGEQVAQVVETGIQQYGNQDEQADLDSFLRRPERYADMMQHVLADIATREPTFAQQLQRVAEQTNVAQRGGVTGTATATTNSGQNVGVNTGTMTQSNQTVSGDRAVGIGGDASGPITTGDGNT